MNKQASQIVEHILRTYIKGSVPGDLDTNVRQWITSDAHIEEKNRALWNIWNETQPAKDPGASKSLEEVKRRLGIKEPQKKRIGRTVLLAAAVLGPILAVISGFLFFNRYADMSGENLMTNNYVIQTANTDTYRNIILPDSTRVWVNSGSRMVWSDDRKVMLEGEGYFDVTRRGEEVFTVNTGRLTAMVTGTRFNIRAFVSEDLHTVSLYEGSLRIETEDGISELIAGEELAYDIRTGETVINKIYRTRPEWTRGIIDYRDHTVQSIFNSLAEIYGISILTAGLDPEDKIINLKVEEDLGIMEILQILSDLCGDFVFEKTGDTIYIKGIE